jgi:threonine dehydrogenase-like Zn-dependent dehydrogenase
MAVITAPRTIDFQERPMPVLADHDVLIRVKAAAICGSDLHLFRGKHPSVSLPSAVGHELAGVVEAVGGAVSSVQKGNRVAVEPLIVCGTCEFCRAGRYNLCTRFSVHYRQGQGAFAPYFVTKETWLHVLPDNVSFEEGALVEPLAVAVHAVEKAGVSFGTTAAIFGDGAIGLFTLMLLKAAGGGATFLVGLQASRLAKAKTLGASEVYDNAQGDPVEAIVHRTDGMGTDVSFEAVGRQEPLMQALRVLKKGGTTVVLGIFQDPDVTVNPNIFIQKEIALVGSQGYCRDFPKALALLRELKIPATTLITHVLPLESLEEGFRLLQDPDAGAVKVVVQID